MSSTPPPAWLAELANHVTAVIRPADVMSPLGCHYQFVDGVWEVTIFASMTEIVGGERDGLRFPSRFSIDLQALLLLFDEVATAEWQVLPLGPEDDLGAHLSIEGTYGEQPVWLRIPAQAPQRFEIGRYANVYEMRFVDMW